MRCHLFLSPRRFVLALSCFLLVAVIGKNIVSRYNGANVLNISDIFL